MAGKTKLVGFRIEPAAWDAFCQAAKYYDMQPQDCLRDLIYHAKRAIEAVETGKVKSMNGDMAEFLVKEFPNLKWGTRDPVAFKDDELGLIRLRATESLISR